MVVDFLFENLSEFIKKKKCLSKRFFKLKSNLQMT